MTGTLFPDHTTDTAPTTALRSMEATTKRLGYLPAPVARLATSPHLLDGFLKISAIFESTTLDALSREVLIMTIATRNGCHVCVAMHTAKLTALGADAELIKSLREQRGQGRQEQQSQPQPLSDERLEAVRQFTLDVIATSGAVSDDTLRRFLAHGYTPQNALEVVLGIGAYTMSTLANRMTGAPLDEQLARFAWDD